MPCILVPSSICSHIFPKYRVALDRLESYPIFDFLQIIAVDLFSTLQELAPSSIFNIWHCQSGKLCPAPFAISVNIYHESADTIGFSAAATPVIVMNVVAPWAISLCSKAFDVDIWPPSLKVTSSVLDAPHDIIAVNESNLREANIFSDRCLCSSRDSRWRKFVLAVCILVT